MTLNLSLKPPKSTLSSQCRQTNHQGLPKFCLFLAIRILNLAPSPTWTNKRISNFRLQMKTNFWHKVFHSSSAQTLFFSLTIWSSLVEECYNNNAQSTSHPSPLLQHCNNKELQKFRENSHHQQPTSQQQQQQQHVPIPILSGFKCFYLFYSSTLSPTHILPYTQSHPV